MKGGPYTGHFLLSQLGWVQKPASRTVESWGWEDMGGAPGLQGPSLCPRHSLAGLGGVFWEEGGKGAPGRGGEAPLP